MRVFHWALVVGFGIAYLTEADLVIVHVWAGYVVGLLVVARIRGISLGRYTRASQISSTIPARPRYVPDLILFRGERHHGHRPGGGAMVILLRKRP